jgi:hypothetical protein
MHEALDASACGGLKHMARAFNIAAPEFLPRSSLGDASRAVDDNVAAGQGFSERLRTRDISDGDLD